jgi:hypothetical protein
MYSFPSIIRIIKSRRMRWAGHVAQLGAKRNAYRIEKNLSLPGIEILEENNIELFVM